MDMETKMTNIEGLCQAWLEAKRDEAAANARRIAVEEQMIQAMEVPDEGSKTHKLDGYKVTVTQPVTRKIDLDAWANVEDKCPAELRPVKIVAVADAPGMKWLQEHQPRIWKKIASAFETKPGKVGFKVEAL
jgi:hypothetical protein